MYIKKYLFSKLLLYLIFITPFLSFIKAESADEIKITYSIFSKTIKIQSLKEYSRTGKPEKKLKKLLKRLDSTNDKNLEILTKNFDIPLPIASKLLYSEIGNVILTRVSKVIHPPRARDERTGKLALRASIIKGIDIGEGKINLINFSFSHINTLNNARS